MNKRITVVAPVFNEAGNIAPLHEALTRVFADIKGYEFQLLFVDDGSTDGSRAHISELLGKDPNVSSIELSRNFGKEAALSAGLAQAEGDAVVLIDADLQHPPELIREFITQWEGGADVVIGVRKKNPDESFVRSLGSKLFSYVMRQVGDVATVSGATDFRLLDRAVVEEFKRFTEHGRMTRGLIDWLGFRRAYVPFNANKRHAGKARYDFRKLIVLGFSALVSHSLLPLKLAGYLGVPITLVAGSLGFFILVEQVLLGDPLHMEVPGTAMLAVMILFLNGILLISLGLMSLYIAQIHHEAANRPLFVIRRRQDSDGTK